MATLVSLTIDYLEPIFDASAKALSSNNSAAVDVKEDELNDAVDTIREYDGDSEGLGSSEDEAVGLEVEDAIADSNNTAVETANDPSVSAEVEETSTADVTDSHDVNEFEVASHNQKLEDSIISTSKLDPLASLRTWLRDK